MAIDKITEHEKCCGCGVCETVCPKRCITMQPNEEGFLYPLIDADACIECGRCQKSCPVNKVIEDKEDWPRKVYALRNKNKEILYKSSSGGFFYEIARSVIERGGCVFGVVFDEGRVVYAKAQQLQELIPMLGSKYVQSDKHHIWAEVKKELATGREVLFSGTPCEVGALRSYLNKDWSNLTCVDFICMGVPSPGVLGRHLHDLEQRYGAKAVNIGFRNKKYGAYTHSLSIDFANGRHYFRPQYAEPYVKSFHSRIYLRRSCHQCSYKQAYRVSDITMADFWGLTSTNIPMTMEGGVSMVIVHSEKGANYFNAVSNCFEYYETDMATARRVQPMLTTSCQPSDSRDLFFKEFVGRPDKTFSSIITRYEPISWRDSLRARLKTLTLLRRIVQGTKKKFPQLRHM